MGLDLSGDPVKQHDFLNLLVLPLIALGSTVATWTRNPRVSVTVINTLLSYMACDALYIALRPQSVPSAKLVLFHHFVSVCGLSHGVRYPSAKVLVASYGLIEIHTSYMTFRRLTGLRSHASELLFQATTVLVRLVIIPALVILSFKNLYELDVLFKLEGVPSLTAVLGLSFFNAQFLLKRKAMFNYTGKKE
ncbi:hypothetical protein HKI87_01g05310 [Chloropicon roscoffensis]|uniref:TLC domain-containing protein n=1 Tax=Chloropicon roscoffensis TaxID=1461544 RepID=A0A7S3CC19_9CHLO|mmetsp:Transcript_2773/g.8408  ORF Transcript_2773/g.8408 Transcript_2773/m.8408 type:complete len:192 (+) Transcript_2773:118-693(+)